VTSAVAAVLHATSALGPFALAAATCATALALTTQLRRRRTSAATVTAPSLRAILTQAGIRSALTVMATAQVVMVTVMTSMPPMMHAAAVGLGSSGLMLSGHTLGMFALAPLTGHLVDRYDARPIMVAGVLLLASSTVGAGAAPSQAIGAAMLFLLGYAWNLCFVSGSVRVAVTVSPDVRIAVEGTIDAAAWGLAAVAALTSTIVLSAGGYLLLTMTAATLAALPALALTTEHQPPDRIAGGPR